MKKAMMSILKKIVISIYRLSKSIKLFISKAVKLLHAVFSPSHKRYSSQDMAGKKAVIGTHQRRFHQKKTDLGTAVTKKQKNAPSLATFFKESSGVPAVSQQTTRFRSRKIVFWKDKRIIAGAAAFFLIAVTVIVLALPGSSDKAYASGLDAIYAGTDDSNAEASASSENSVSTGTDGSVSTGTDGSVSTGTDGDDSVLTSESGSVETDTAEATPLPTTEPEEVQLALYSYDSRVIEIQEKLMELGYLENDEPTDYYGYNTYYALQLFQRKHNLQIDGLAGEETLGVLFSDEALPYTVKLGDSGTDVESLQERLIELNYLKTSATGYFGTDTEDAVESFQSRNGLSVDGNIGEMTREALYSADARSAATTSSGGSSSGGSSSGGSSSGGSSSGGSTTHANVYVEGDPTVEALIAYARTKLGCDYTWGAKGPNSFDCSGFVYYCLNQIGYKISYMTSSGWANCDLPKITSMSDMIPGDIICYSGHVAIYIGNGMMIDASSKNDQVIERQCTSSYWTSHFICARRILS